MTAGICPPTNRGKTSIPMLGTAIRPPKKRGEDNGTRASQPAARGQAQGGRLHITTIRCHV